jgi:hypothetical protein
MTIIVISIGIGFLFGRTNGLITSRPHIYGHIHLCKSHFLISLVITAYFGPEMK